jgi:ankyrin repeat protein
MKEEFESLIKQMQQGTDQKTTFLSDAIKNGFDVNTETEHNFPLIHYACFNNKEACALILLKNGANVNYGKNSFLVRTPLFFAAAHGMTNAVRLLCNLAPYYIDLKNDAGTTPFLIASLKGHLETMKILHAYGANIFIENNSKQDAMHYTLSGNHSKNFQWLIENGFDINETRHLELAISRNLTRILAVYFANETILNKENKELFHTVRLNLLLNHV